MKFRQIYFDDFMKDKDYFYQQIPKAQNSDLHYQNDIFEYYMAALKEHKQAFISICEENNEIIGCACIRYYQEEDKFFLVNVNTRKDYQNTSQHIATKVVSAGLNNFFEKSGQLEIFLWVNKDNIAALKAYKHNGFKPSTIKLEKLEFYNHIKDDMVFSCTKNDYIKSRKNLNERKVSEVKSN